MARTSSKQTGGWPTRVARVARALPAERRLAAFAAIGLFLTLFLPWYQDTVVARTLRTGSASLTGWGAFSWVEAAVLLVAGGVLTLLFQRAEGRAFHVPGGDGGVIMAAGAWTSVLVIWRIFDKQGVSSHGIYEASSGIEWGIFVALAMAVLLAYAGNRIRAAHQPEPPLPGEGAREPLRPRRRRSAPDHRTRHSYPDDRPARPAPRENPIRRLFEDRPPLYERPEWSAPPVDPFDPEAPLERPGRSPSPVASGQPPPRPTAPSATGAAPRPTATPATGPTRTVRHEDQLTIPLADRPDSAHLRHEHREVDADGADQQDPGDDQRPRADDVADDADQQPDRHHR